MKKIKKKWSTLRRLSWVASKLKEKGIFITYQTINGVTYTKVDKDKDGNYPLWIDIQQYFGGKSYVKVKKSNGSQRYKAKRRRSKTAK